MSDTALVVHRGARLVTRQELDSVETPPPTETWFPLAHSYVLERTLATLEQAGFRSNRTQLALSRGDNQFFGTIDLESPIIEGVSLAVGVRNSIDKSLPIAFAAGERIFICDYADLPIMCTGGARTCKSSVVAYVRVAIIRATARS